jgi:hypothetical protein
VGIDVAFTPRSATIWRSIAVSRTRWLLPSVLSITAGSVDTISFLALGGLATAHITGNLLILALGGTAVGTGINAPPEFGPWDGIKSRLNMSFPCAAAPFAPALTALVIMLVVDGPAPNVAMRSTTPGAPVLSP